MFQRKEGYTAQTTHVMQRWAPHVRGERRTRDGIVALESNVVGLVVLGELVHVRWVVEQRLDVGSRTRQADAALESVARARELDQFWKSS